MVTSRLGPLPLPPPPETPQPRPDAEEPPLTPVARPFPVCVAEVPGSGSFAQVGSKKPIKNKNMAAKEKLEAVLNVALRVPSIMLLDVLYRWDVSSFFQQIQRSSLNNNPLFQYKYLALNMHYVGYVLSVVLLTLPRQHLVQLYLYFLTALLLYAGHQISR
ncbi:hypothetical protein U0070_025018 [Myodes glareolus]|uniref:TRC8-like N-terminal domain-containing protein n=1 Tax=Myodes glareolus TaxID=447135 RepID=A0AAW0HSW5_MYOGA